MRSIQRFDLPLPAGSVWLDLPCSAPDQGLQQARALAAALPVLAALEAWWSVALPVPEPVARHAGDASGLQLPFAADSPLAGGQLCLPWAVIPPGRVAPASLPVQWPQVPAQMCLQTLAASRIENAGLVPGAVLLLPAAFSRRWQVQLQGTDAAGSHPPHPWLAPATWLPHEGHVLLHGAEPTGPVTTTAHDEPWSVWRVPPFGVDLRAWLGGSPLPALATPGLVELRHSQSAVGWGRLLPCGDGWALRLDRVEQTAAVRAWT